MSDAEFTIATNLFVAGLIGLAVGIEREWSGHASGPLGRFAGVRTFLILGLTGGVGGSLAVAHPAVAVTVIGSVALLTIVAYWRATGQPQATLDGTSETAALAVLAFGAMAGLGYRALAGALAAVVTLALGEKETMHRLVRRIGVPEMRAALEFGVLALAVWPMLPDGPFGGPLEIRPRLIWGVVLLFSGLNFAGYLARRIAGESRGDVLTGALGGLISSTAVTLDFARTSRAEPTHARSLAMGVAAACGVLLLRVLLSTSLLAPSLGLALSPLIIGPLLVAAATVASAFRKPSEDSTAPRLAPRNPLGLWSALRMGLLLQLLLTAFQLTQHAFGRLALLPMAALLGAVDVDALTVSVVTFVQSGGAPDVAARAMVIGIISNTAIKTIMAITFGAPRFRGATVGRLVLQGAALGASAALAAAL
ncbi:MAG TPA: MgtC/SapB family protein [Gemmatimonadaceae bacterium]|nr:MgtC/SapB family protein [Gemmatimonadaceae bacterium]